MAHRDLVLASCDVAEPHRLGAALRLARRYATGGQSSVHEWYLTAAERLRASSRGPVIHGSMRAPHESGSLS